MNISQWFSTNKASVLMGSSLVGIGALGVTSFRAGVRCAPILEKYQNDPNLSKRDRVKAILKETAWYHVPPILIGVATGACVVGSYSSLLQSAAAANAVAAMATSTATDLREQMKKELGPTGAQRIEDHSIEERMKKKPVSGDPQHTGHGNLLVRNMIGGRDFYACHEWIKEAIDRASEVALTDGVVTVNQFFNYLGIDSTDLGHIAGWDVEDLDSFKIPVSITTILSDEYEPILAISTYRIRSFKY